MKEEDDLHLARLSIDDLTEIALEWRLRSLRGDRTTADIAQALESVVRQRRADALSRARVHAVRRPAAPVPAWRRAAEWALSRR